MSNPTTSKTSPSLIMRAKVLDKVAWERLSKLYTPLVVQWVRSANLQESDASDVVQDVFQAVAKNISKFEMGPGLPPFRGWLWGITRHKVKDFFRSQATRPNAEGGTKAQIRTSELPEKEPIDSQSEPDSFTNRDSIAFRALELIKTDFKETTWQAFWQVTIDGRAPADVAADLGLSIGSVYTCKSRVLSHLRHEFGGLT